MFDQINQKFPELFKKFKAGTAWMRMHHKRFDHEVQRFEQDVVQPMDTAWFKMTDAERQNFLEKEANARYYNRV